MTVMHLPRYATVEKSIGETPLQAAERLRKERGLPADIPLAYAGRLDPMASGKLLILIGDECKRQKHYHGLDKEYEFGVLFGIHSDTGDVLGIVERSETSRPFSASAVAHALAELVGKIELPYPQFSSKTVHGKPLHEWTLEGRIHEIEIPTRHSHIHALSLLRIETLNVSDLVKKVRHNISLVERVSDPKKALGRDFRRDEVLASWEAIRKEGAPDELTIARLRCTASSGTYMRTLAEIIALRLGGKGLAYEIKRTKIGKYISLFGLGLWITQY